MVRPRKRPRTHRPTPASRRVQPDSTRAVTRWPWILGSVVVGAGIIAIALSSSPPGDDAAAVAGDPVAVAQGAELYAASCAVCHGADLTGTATGPPFLDVTYAPNHHADEAFQRAVVGGVVAHHWNFGPMAPIAGLDRSEVALIVGFVRSEQEAAGIIRDPSHP